MIDSRIKLDVLEDNASVFTDHSNEAADYLRDNFTVAMAPNTDYLYVGFYKPINALYAEFETPDASGATLSLEAWDGAAWSPVEFQDETQGWSRSGFLSWNREDMAEVEVNGETKYWVRFVNDTASAAVFKGLNLVFSDDEMLKREFPNINDPRILPAGFSSNIVHHVSARNLIVQILRNEGNIKYDSENRQENITQWDLLDIYEIREAATYLALSKIFFLLSDNTEDTWFDKHKTYKNLYDKTFATAKLSIDVNNDGIPDNSEKLATRKSIRFSR